MALSWRGPARRTLLFLHTHRNPSNFSTLMISLREILKIELLIVFSKWRERREVQ